MLGELGTENRGVIPAKAPFPFGAVLGGLSLPSEHELARQPLPGRFPRAFFRRRQKPAPASLPFERRGLHEKVAAVTLWMLPVAGAMLRWRNCSAQKN